MALKKAIIASYLLVNIVTASVFSYLPTVSAAETVYTFRGGGKGHGVGMCMTSVLAQAKAGRDFRTIMGFFYGHISIRDHSNWAKTIKAAVFSIGEKRDLFFQANNSIKVYNTRGHYFATPRKDDIVGVRYGDGRYRVRIWRDGKEIFSRLTNFSIIIKHWRANYIKLRNNGRRYRGDFFARSVGGSFIWAINHVPREDYLKGLGEEPETWPLKGLRTLAVAARTYAVRKVFQKNKHYDIAQNQQYYVGFRFNVPRLTRAVNETKGLVATYMNYPILAAYSAHCGGYVADFTSVWGGTGYPYLKGKRDTWCRNYSGHSWGPVSFRRTTLERIFRNHGVNIGTLKDIVFLDKGMDDHRPQKVKLVGTGGTRIIWAFSEFAAWLGLKSSLMRFTKSS